MFDSAGGNAAENALFCPSRKLASDDALSPPERTCFPRTPSTSGAARLSRLLPVEPLRPANPASAEARPPVLLPNNRLSSLFPHDMSGDELPAPTRPPTSLSSLALTGSLARLKSDDAKFPSPARFASPLSSAGNTAPKPL